MARTRSMQGSAANTTQSAGQFLVKRVAVVKLPPSFPNVHKRFLGGGYRHINKLTGADQNPSPGVVRYQTKYPKSR